MVSIDESEKHDILNELLVKWMGGASIKTAELDLVKEGVPQMDVSYCRKIFEKWSSSGKSWTEIRKMK